MGQEQGAAEPIAIVGAAIRMPGGHDDLAGFSAFLREGGSATGPVPPDRWDTGPLGAGDATPYGAFVDGIDQFDARFFNIAPREADYVDPQQRLVLETSWRALESAGVDTAPLRGGNGGVYMGVSCVDYAVEVEALGFDELNAHVGTGSAHSAVPGRVSYFLGWRGPSVAVDTACSSSLVALHQAVQGLRLRECDIALSGGVNAMHHPRNHIIFTEAGMLAPDGRCKTFDDSADGYCRGEGCGVVVLKRLADAERDGDTVLAVVRGSAVGQDGASGGLTVPHGGAQERVMRVALASAGVDAGSVQYVEAHGTGTSLGDPIEMGAIQAVFGASRDASHPVLVGSVKTNVGHMEPAAGISGVVKVILQLREGTVFPHINFATPSRHIPWDRYAVEVPVAARPWEGAPRRAVVNSFGFQGTLASVVLEQAPAAPAPSPPDPAPAPAPAVLTLSARTDTALGSLVDAYRRRLAEDPELSVHDLCYTTNVGRTHLPERLAGVVGDRAELTALLDRARGARGVRPRRVAFLLTGQGAQYAGMGRDLYRDFPVFRTHLDACDRLFEPHLGRSIRELMFATDDEAAQLLERTGYAQPALFSLEYALARLWWSFGVRPDVLIGHSVGEVVAATLAGLFDLEDAVTLVAARARLMQSVTTPGGMAAVASPAEDVAPLLEPYPDLTLAAVNAPRQCVVSGGTASLDAVTQKLRGDGHRVTPMRVSHAFHSPLMAEVVDDFVAALAGIRWREPELGFVSNVTGERADLAEVSTPEYWARHLLAPVDFRAGMAAIERRGAHLFVEIGPAAVLTALGRACVAAPKDHVWAASQRREDPARALRDAAARVYAAGVPLDWTAFHAGRQRRRVALPEYVFEHRRYWLPVAGRRHGRVGASPDATPVHALLGTEVSSEEQRAAGTREFAAELSATAPGFLADHVVTGQVVFPGAGYVEILLALQDAVYGENRRAVRGLRIHEPLLLADEPVSLRTRLRPADGGAECEIVSVSGAVERRHATARLGTADGGEAELRLAEELRAEAGGGAAAALDAEEFYEQLAELGLDYGPRFRLLASVARTGPDAAAGILSAADAAGVEQLPPPVLDCSMQTLVAAVDGSDTHLPVGFELVRLFRKPRGALRSLVRLRPPSPTTDADRCADVVVLDAEDAPVFVVNGLQLRRLERPAGSRAPMVHETRWMKRSLPQSSGDHHARRVLLVGAAVGELADAERLAESGARCEAAADAAAASGLLTAETTDVCWFWRPEDAASGHARLRAESERNFRELLSLLAAMDDRAPAARLWLVTEGAQVVAGDRTAERDVDALAAASLWGFGRTMRNEYPRRRVTLVDLPPGAGPRERGLLVEEWLAGEGGTSESQVAYRASGRHVRRIVSRSADAPDPGGLELVVDGRGGGMVRTVPCETPDPVDDQMQIRVHAAGLNFKDVLNALGLLERHAEDAGIAYQPLPLGFEGAGTVLAAGPRAGFAVGQEVIFSHLGSLRGRVTVPSAAAVAKPAGLDFAQAAGVASAFLTAYYALHDLAGIRAGDRVLIHAAAGGVGQAAVQLARLAGAEVFATASPAKQALLRAQGVRHVWNSRTLDFAEGILEATSGRGVDIVLNSLNKDYIPAGMRVLATGGRFVELGKIGIWSPERVAAERPDATYHTFDLSEVPEPGLTELTHRIMRTVVDLLDRGELRPLPTVSYGLDEAEEAFGVLSRGANVGKLVVSFVDDHAPAPQPLRVSPEETYLVTGGSGALGLVAARTLVELGARRIALMSRRPPEGGAPRLGEGVEVDVLTGDVAEPADVARVLERLRSGPHPLGGVIHAAGVLADAPITEQSWESIETVLRPKVYGAHLLHRGLADFPRLRFFVSYSSVSSVLGTPGQANYAAANTYLDELMSWRALGGDPGFSVGWGPWAGAGMAARLDERAAEGIARRGVRPLRPRSAMRALHEALARPVAHAMVGELDWARYVAAQPGENPLFHLVAADRPRAGAELDLAALREKDTADRLAAISDFLRHAIRAALHFDEAETIDPEARFSELGLDSLMAVELKNSLEAAFETSLPASLVFDHPSIPELVAFLATTLFGEPQAPAPAPASVESLSDEEARAELDALRDLT
ncbi:type I polyketide synthase [Streptomyces sp. 4N509B]|uniref:type I polyketide synthase n=1 Tax=Streptomyces sp. 4N509B TaxID=3457413 RepID=UPI003FD37E3E